MEEKVPSSSQCLQCHVESYLLYTHLFCAKPASSQPDYGPAVPMGFGCSQYQDKFSSGNNVLSDDTYSKEATEACLTHPVTQILMLLASACAQEARSRNLRGAGSGNTYLFNMN